MGILFLLKREFSLRSSVYEKILANTGAKGHLSVKTEGPKRLP